MKDKAGQLMVKPNIQRKDSVQTVGKKAEKPELSMLPLMVDVQSSGVFKSD